MPKTDPIGDRLYTDPCYLALVRIIRYDGCLYRELWDKLKDLVTQYGQERVESATANLLEYEGQFRVNPPPLAQVQLRPDVRTRCWQLLGPPPEHPWFELWKKPEPLPPPWEMEMDGTPKKKSEPTEESQAPKPKRTRKKAN